MTVVRRDHPGPAKFRGGTPRPEAFPVAGLAIILVAGVLYLTLWWYARSETVSSVLAAWGADRPWVRVLVAAGLVAFGAWFYWHLWGFGVP